MNKFDLRAVKTEELIREAFIDCVKDTPFKQLTVTQICGRARISRFTFYAHYEDKQHLLGSLQQALEEELSGSISREVLEHARKGDFMPSAQRFIRDVRRNGPMIGALMKCDRESVVRIIGHAYLDSVTAMYVDRYEQIVRSRPDVLLTRRYFVNALTGYAEEMAEHPSFLSEEELIGHFYALIAHTGRYYIDQLRGKGLPGHLS